MENPDEVGALISNFNKMQVELNHSADSLSKTQRDLGMEEWPNRWRMKLKTR